MASRYAAVFPLSELINWIYHTRGQRHEELPHSYQMMLFWAGLRGAVGVALAASLTGENADALRTTVLVVVVLTVIVFGGTTARMLEVLGIRVGVEDEDASSDEEEGYTTRGNNSLSLGYLGANSSRRYPGQNGRSYSLDEDEVDVSPSDGGYYSNRGARRGGRMGIGRQGSRTGFSTSNSDDSDDGEPLPTAGYSDEERGGSSSRNVSGTGIGGTSGPPQPDMIFRDGQWFTALDERYLLPLFSNSVTARRHHAKKAKKASVYAESGSGTPRGHSLERERDDANSPAESAVGTGSRHPYGAGGGGAGAGGEDEEGRRVLSRTFSGSVSDFFFKSDMGSQPSTPITGSGPTR